MHARRGKPDHHVARRDVRARQQRAALGRADRKAGEIVVAAVVDAGHFRGLAADQRAAGLPAASATPVDHRGADLGIELAAGEIVEEEQRLRALHHEVVDRHGDEIDADRVVPAGLDRDLDLGADAVGGGDQDRIGKAGALEVEQAAEAADFGVRARPRGRAHQRLDQLHHAVAGIDVDAGAARSCALVRHDVPSFGARSYVGIRSCAMAALAVIVGRASGVPGTVQRAESRGARLSIPNLITLGRILLVPVVVWAITSGEMRIAFLLFLAAGISDAVDGFLAKRFGMASELGAYLDPLADKALIVSIYVALGIAARHPALARHPRGLARHHDRRRLHAVLAGGQADAGQAAIRSPSSTPWRRSSSPALVLAARGFDFDAGLAPDATMAAVAVLTLLSVAFYLAEWIRHMNSFGAGMH